MTAAEKHTTQILAISTDSPEESKKLVDRLRIKIPDGLDFPLLEDKDHKVIDRYGILNPQGNRLPIPATYLIDKKGIVRWKFVELDYRKRPTNEQIIAALRAIPKGLSGSRIEPPALLVPVLGRDKLFAVRGSRQAMAQSNASASISSSMTVD